MIGGASDDESDVANMVGKHKDVTRKVRNDADETLGILAHT